MARTDQHLVVDGSNIATEGRSLPSLAQLDEAVQAIAGEYNYDSLTVIVDATFAHRIDESEQEEFEAAVVAGEIVAPPAGAVGRGDAFILQVAAKAGAVVFSNDSFQEFHGEHDWLFQEGRLIGGKPIDGVGWIFIERVPVRGPTSRRAVREAEERSSSRRRPSKAKPKPKPKPKATRSASRSSSGPPPVPTKANPPPSKRKDKSEGSKQEVEELNDARAFMGFVGSYSIGDEVEGVVERFSSHGCYLRAASARCYLPSRAMGDPPPSRARDVVSTGQTVIVRVESIDSGRRGINVALVRVVDRDDETGSKKQAQDQGSQATRSRRQNPAKPSHDSDVVADDSGRERHLTRSTPNVATTRPAKSAARKRPAAKKAGAKKAAKATSSARVKRATAKKTTTARKVAAKPASAKKTVAKKTARQPAAKKTARKRASAKTTARQPAAKKTARKRASVAKKTAARKPAARKTARERASVAKTAARKPAAKKAAAKATPAKTTARKTTAREPAAKNAATRKTARKQAARRPGARKAAAKK